jgi:hypothetical protein
MSWIGFGQEDVSWVGREEVWSLVMAVWGSSKIPIQIDCWWVDERRPYLISASHCTCSQPWYPHTHDAGGPTAQREHMESVQPIPVWLYLHFHFSRIRTRACPARRRKEILGKIFVILWFKFIYKRKVRYGSLPPSIYTSCKPARVYQIIR